MSTYPREGRQGKDKSKTITVGPDGCYRSQTLILTETNATSPCCLLSEIFAAFFRRSQEHVTPHIGLTVEPITIHRDEFLSRKLEDPMYNLEDEATLAIARVAALDDYQKTMIEVQHRRSCFYIPYACTGLYVQGLKIKILCAQLVF